MSAAYSLNGGAHDPISKTGNKLTRKALLLRVGIDRGTGGALGPIFPDGRFEYIPIPEEQRTRITDTYATLPVRHGRSLTAFLPARIAGLHPHIDPDFNAATYGDTAPRKRRQLARLAPHDLLVFYSGLIPWPSGDAPRLFVIGYFQVREIHRLQACDIRVDGSLRRRFGLTAHFARCVPDRELVLVQGYRTKGRLFNQAVPLGDARQFLLRDLAPFGYQGSLQRAVGHWIRTDSAVKSLEAWLREGPTSLIQADTRLFQVSRRAVRSTRQMSHRGDLLILDRRPTVGDWVFAKDDGASSRIVALARLNDVRIINGRHHGSASLFWHFAKGVSEQPDGAELLMLGGKPLGRGNTGIYRLVSWFSAHHRIGYHLESRVRE